MLARGEVPVMLALRLFLRESWTSDRARLKRTGVPAEYRTAGTKPEMALAQIDRVGARLGAAEHPKTARGVAVILLRGTLRARWDRSTGGKRSRSLSHNVVSGSLGNFKSELPSSVEKSRLT